MGTAYFLHCDLDPRAGEDVAAEQQRLHQLVDQWPFDIPPPDIVIFSGGGFQLFWTLADKFEIGGSLERCAEFERYNRYIEQLLDADNCHNVDRIMRVPGTWNLPDETKRKKDREKVKAALLRDTGERHDLSAFPQAPPKDAEVSADSGGQRHRVVVPEHVTRIDDLEMLDEWDVPDKFKVVIAQGDLPAEDRSDKQQSFSRSDWLFWVCCELVRCAVPDSTIFAIITDRRWPISDHVFDQKVPAPKYAVRQIERAHDFAIDKNLEKFNRRFSVIQNLGGKCMVVERRLDQTMDRERVTKQAPGQFREAFGNRKIEVGKNKDGSPVYKKAGHWWLDHPLRREFATMEFNPAQPTHYGDVYNLWQGFGVEPALGNKHQPFLDHVRDNLCNSDQRLYEYVVGWMARAVKKPGQPGETAIVLRGPQGTGKTFFADHLGRLFGQHYLPVSDGAHLVGNFNNHLRDCVLLFADEAFYAGDRKHRSVLKTLITSHTLAYEAKGVDVESGPNCVHLVIASNEEWVVPTDVDDRRFLVLDVAAHRANDSDYFRDIAQGMRAGGYASLLNFLQNYDLSEFNVRQLIDTDAKRQQKVLSLTATQRAVYDLLREGDFNPLATRGDGYVFVSTKLTAADAGLNEKQETALGRELGKAADGKTKRYAEGDGGAKTEAFEAYLQKYAFQPRGVWMPPIDEARSNWAAANKLNVKWPWADGVERDDDDIPF